MQKALPETSTALWKYGERRKEARAGVAHLGQ